MRNLLREYLAATTERGVLRFLKQSDHSYFQEHIKGNGCAAIDTDTASGRQHLSVSRCMDEDPVTTRKVGRGISVQLFQAKRESRRGNFAPGLGGVRGEALRTSYRIILHSCCARVDIDRFGLVTVNLGSSVSSLQQAVGSSDDPATGRDRKMNDCRGGFVLKSRSDDMPSHQRRRSLVERSADVKRSIMQVS